MAPIPPKALHAVRNYTLRISVEDIHHAYNAAIAGLQHRESEIEESVRRQLGLAPDAPFPDADPYDPDDPIGALYEDAGEQDSQAKRGAPLVRHAFLIALFHLWERHCNAQFKTKDYNSTQANTMLKAAGHESLCLSITELQLAANCAKHGRGPSGGRLFRKRPDFFPHAKDAEQANERTLLISDETLQQFFQIILEATR